MYFVNNRNWSATNNVVRHRRFLLHGMLAVFVMLSGCGLGHKYVERKALIQNPPSLHKGPARPPLYEKTASIEERMARRHLTEEGLLAYQVDSRYEEDARPTAFADMAIWTGCYLAAEAFRYKATGEKEALARIEKLASAIDLLVNASAKPGLLARAVREKGSFPLEPEWHPSPYDPKLLWLGDVSTDQVDGVLFGAGAAYDAVEDPTIKQMISGWVEAIVDNILNAGMIIEDVDGKQTKHGDLTCGLLSENLNCLIALSGLKVAHHLTGEIRFERAYHELVRKGYAKKAVSARDPWWEAFTGVNHSDNNLAFLAYYNLIRYERDETLLDIYHRSLRRAWSVVRHDRNPFFTYLYHAIAPPSTKEIAALDEAMDTLIRYPLDPMQRDVAHEKDVSCVSFFRDGSDRRQACSPLPIDRRSPGPMEWNENPSRLEFSDFGPQVYSGLDYLLAYWLGRAHGFVSKSA